MSNRDEVSSYLSTETQPGRLVDGQTITGLAYNNRPFDIVKGVHNVAGFSATSHYRISQLALELFSKNEDLGSDLAKETASREAAVASLTSALTNETASREAAVASLTGDLNSKETTLNNSITTKFNDQYGVLSGVSNSLNSAISTHHAVSTSINTDLTGLTNRVDTFENEQNAQLKLNYENLSNALVAETSNRTTAIGNETTARSDAIAAVDALIDQEVLDRDAAYDTISTAVNTNVQTLTSQIDSISNAFNAALAGEASARLIQDNALQSNINTVSSTLSTVKADLQAKVDNITENTDPAALDSLTELLAAFQSADNNITTTLQGMVSTANANNASHDERLDYLEKFCTMASSFLHMMHSDGTNDTPFTFPPTNDNKNIYAGIGLQYDQTNVYTHLVNAPDGYDPITL